MGGHILLGGYLLLEDMCYKRICFTGGHALQEDISYQRICLR